MRSIRELIEQERSNGSTAASLRQLAMEHGVRSVRALLASHDIRDFHYRTGGEWGPLGVLHGTTRQEPDGTFTQDFPFGEVMKDPNGVVTGTHFYEATITVAGMHCFATDDPGGNDEFFAVVTAMSVNPQGNGEPEVVTKRFNIVDVHGGDEDGEVGSTVNVDQEIGTIGVAGSGIRIHVALFDHEYGSEEEVQERFTGYFKEAGKAAATALWGAAGWAAAEEALDSKIAKDVFGGLIGWFTGAFSDDPIGEKTYSLTDGDMYRLAQVDNGHFVNYEQSLMASPVLPPGVKYNFPIDGDANPYWLISEGAGDYKVYFRVKVRHSVQPVDPPSSP